MQSSTDLRKSRKSTRKSVHFQGDFPVNYLTKEEYLQKKHIPNEEPDDKFQSQPPESLFFQPTATRNPFVQEEEAFGKADLEERDRKIEEQKAEIEQFEQFISDLLEQLSKKDEQIRELQESKQNVIENTTQKEDNALNVENNGLNKEEEEEHSSKSHEKSVKNQEVQVFLLDSPESPSGMRDDVARLARELEERTAEVLEKNETMRLMRERQKEEIERFESEFKELMMEFMRSKEKMSEEFLELLMNYDNRIKKLESDVNRFREIAEKNRGFVKKITELNKKINGYECGLETGNRKIKELEVKIETLLEGYLLGNFLGLLISFFLN